MSQSPDYQKGYAAGRRRVRREDEAAIASRRREAFRRDAALIVLNAMMLPGNAWGRTIDGVHKPYSTMDEYVQGAFTFADKMVARSWFDGGPMEPQG